MATSWKSQQGNGECSLQFKTDDKDKYKLVEKAAQMAVDGKTAADVKEVRHGVWQIEDRGGKPTDRPICSRCGATPKYYVNGKSSPYCHECGSKMEREVKPYVR